MANSFVDMVEAFRPLLEQIAASAKPLTRSKTIQVHPMPDPTMDRRSIWIEPPAQAQVEPLDTAFDETTVVLDVCITVPYELQEADKLLAWRLCDLLNTAFPDQMPGHAVLRGTRRRAIQPVREQWGSEEGPVQLTVRCRLLVPVLTPAAHF